VLTIVLGAPGAGKTAVTTRLRAILPGHAIIDWNDFMPEVGVLAARDVPASRDLWAPYRELVRKVIVSLANVPTVLLGVCTPDELVGWPSAHWILLDCDDEERRERLTSRPVQEQDDALVDAWEYRKLGLRVLDTSGRTVDEVAQDLAALVLG
jgi:broad-specificity NMP kinase